MIADAFFHQFPMRVRHLKPRVGAVEHSRLPKLGKRPLQTVDERNANDRIVRNEQRVVADDKPFDKTAPALENVANAFAIFKLHDFRLMAPLTVALGIVGRQFIAIPPFPTAVRDFDQQGFNLNG